MTAALALARAELLCLFRDRAVAVTAVVVPLAMAGWLVMNPPSSEDAPGQVAATAAVLAMMAFTSFAVVYKSVTTLVRRRERHLLERWRISGAAPAAILAGTLGTGVLLLGVLTAVTFPTIALLLGAAPAQPGWVALAVVLAAVLGVAVAMAIASLARTSEAAEVVGLPFIGVLAGGGMWVTFTPLGEITWQMRATGGGALSEILRLGWEGPPEAGLAAALTAVAPSLAALAALTGGLAVITARRFRWRARA